MERESQAKELIEELFEQAIQEALGQSKQEKENV